MLFCLVGGDFCLKVSRGFLQVRVGILCGELWVVLSIGKNSGLFKLGCFAFWDIFAIFLQAVSWAPVAALKAFLFFSLTDERLQGSCFSLVAYSNLP